MSNNHKHSHSCNNHSCWIHNNISFEPEDNYIVSDEEYEAMLKDKFWNWIKNKKIYIKLEWGDVFVWIAPSKNKDWINLDENIIKLWMLELLNTDINILKDFTLNLLISIKNNKKIEDYIFVEQIDKSVLKDKKKTYYWIYLKTKEWLWFLLWIIPEKSYKKALEQSKNKNIWFKNIIFDNVLYNFEKSSDQISTNLYLTLFLNLTLWKENLNKIEELKKGKNKTPQEISNFMYEKLKENFLKKTYII